MILPAPVSGWLRVVILAVGCIVLSFAPVRGEEPLDCRKAEGYLIQNYREQYVPKDFPCPSRWWEYADVAVLALTALMAVWKLGFLPCLLDPYKPFFFAGHALVQKAIAVAGTGFSEPGIVLAGSLAAWAVFAGVVFLGRWIPRPFCRYICPFGVLLGLVSRVAFYRRRIDPDACAACARCETTCPVQAISVDRTRKPALLALSSYQCVQCGRCSDGCKFQASTVAPG